MFPLHETTQRWICRTAFALLCVVPTTALLAYALWTKTPVHRGGQAGELSLRTGTVVSLDELQYPKPGVTRLKNVVLAHAQLREPLARIRELELRREGESLKVHAAQPNFAGEQLDELWRQITQQLLAESFPACRSIHLIASDATLTSADGVSQTFALLEAEYLAHANQRTLRITYQLAGEIAAAPAVLTLVYGQNDSAKVYWNTGGVELPVAPWAARFPALDALGSDCRFHGTITVERSSAGLSGHIAGELTNIDLNLLVSDNLSHKLSGQADVQIHTARFEGDRLIELQADVAAGPGVVSRSLLNGAAEEWNLTTDTASDDAADALMRYEQIVFNVELKEGQLKVSGKTASSPAETILKLPGGKSWQTSPDEVHNPASLIRVLSRQSEADVPATESTRTLIRWLPLAWESSSAEDRSPPRAHLRGP